MARRPDWETAQIERLERQVRELKSINKTLLRRVKKLNKGYYKFLDEEERAQEEPIEPVVNKNADKDCWDCGGLLKVVLVHNRRFRLCQDCGKRTHVKIIK
jgi:formamidopyrimidine-DNA glycosylase